MAEPKDATKMRIQSEKTKQPQDVTHAELEAIKKVNPSFEYKVLKDDVTPAEVKALQAKASQPAPAQSTEPK